MAITTVTVPPRAGTAAEWAASTLVLADGEVGFDTTNNVTKVGDGTNVWADLGSGEGDQVVAGGNSGTAKTIPDSAVGGSINVTMTGNCTFTFPTAGAGKAFRLRLIQDGTGSRLATWPAEVDWPAATAPTLTTTAARSDDLEFYSYDGTNWHGRVLGQDFNP